MKAKAKKVEAAATPTTAVVQWQQGQAPDSLPDGAHIQRIGDEYRTKKGELKKRSSLVIATPTASKIREANPELSESQAQAQERAIGTAIKPAVMARVSAAGSNAAYIVRRYSESKPGKRDSLTVKLERVNTETLIAKFAREYKMTEDEVRAKLGIKDETTIDV